MIKLRVKIFLLNWAYYWGGLIDASIGIVTLGLVDRDLAGKIIINVWKLEVLQESWDDPDDPSEIGDDLDEIGHEWLFGVTEPPSDSDGGGSIDITIFE